MEGAPRLLVAKFAYGLVDKDLKGEDVAIFVQEDAPCGPWRLLGTAVTSEDGEHGTRGGIEDDGGRIFFPIPADLARPVGSHQIRMVVTGDRSQAAFTLHVLRPGTAAVVFDIDGTLTTDDGQVVKQLLGRVSGRRHVPAMRPGADAVVRAWAEAGYFPIYLTGRPQILRRDTEAWLRDKGFPAGALRTAATLGDVLPTSWGVARYKTEALRGWRDAARLEIHAAYGNAETDIEAYREAGIPLDRTWIAGPEAGAEGTRPVQDYRDHLRDVLGTLPRPGVPAPPPVGWPAQGPRDEEAR